MSTPANGQAVTGLVSDPTCPHCRTPIASGTLLASEAQGLLKAIVAALKASDLPVDVPHADDLDLRAELGAAHWSLDGLTYRFVPTRWVLEGVTWRVFFQHGVGGLRWSDVDCPGGFRGSVRHGEAAVGVIQHYIHGRLMTRFWGSGDGPGTPIIAGSGTYAP